VGEDFICSAGGEKSLALSAAWIPAPSTSSGQALEQNARTGHPLLSVRSARSKTWATRRVAERQFRKVQGHREIPALLTALANMVSNKGVAEEGKVA